MNSSNVSQVIAHHCCSFFCIQISTEFHISISLKTLQQGVWFCDCNMAFKKLLAKLPVFVVLTTLICLRTCALREEETRLKLWLGNLMEIVHVNTEFLRSLGQGYVHVTARALSSHWIPFIHSSSIRSKFSLRFRTSKYDTRFFIGASTDHTDSSQHINIMNGNPGLDLYMFITSRCSNSAINPSRCRFFLTFCIIDHFQSQQQFPNWLTSISNPPMNLAATHIRFSTFKVAPFNILSPTNNGLIIDRVWPRMLQHIQKNLNFTLLPVLISPYH